MSKGTSRRSTASGTRNAPSGKSIVLAQKEFQKVKKIMEKEIIQLDGSAMDSQGNNGIRTTYTLDGKTAHYIWHKITWSSWRHRKKELGRALNFCASQALRIRKTIRWISWKAP